jgi:Smg protein
MGYMFEILMFLFENYMGSAGIALKMDNEAILVELEKVGFDRFEINRALHWLDGMVQFQTSVISSADFPTRAIRHYLPDEAERLGVTGQGLLLYLEQIGVLDPLSREIAIDRIMALDHREVDLGRIKWVILMVLFNQPDKKSALTLMQDMVLADAFGVIH